MQQLGIQILPAYSPEARGRSERAFRSHQERLVRELALHGITGMAAANAYLHTHYRPTFNLEFKQPAQEVGTAFVPCKGTQIAEILREHFERTVGHDDCVSFDAMKLQIPSSDTAATFSKPKCACACWRALPALCGILCQGPALCPHAL
jgi:hypothetical protein